MPIGTHCYIKQSSKPNFIHREKLPIKIIQCTVINYCSLKEHKP